MEDQQLSFAFEMGYAGMTVTCKVIMRDQSYDVLFDDRFMATIAYTDDWNWIQEAGVILPEEIIDKIGARIECKYH